MSRYRPNTIIPVDMDGNSIADARSKKLNRGIRIIQVPVIDDKLEIDGWLGTTPEEYTDIPSDELVIYLSLSEESAELGLRRCL